MGKFDSVWTTYWLRSSPFFTEPLEIEGGTINISSLVGRDSEKQKITNLIKLGGGTRFLVIGKAGVGKTSLVNYVRNLAKQENFITPIKEISIHSESLNAQRLMIETIILLGEETMRIGENVFSEDVKRYIRHLQPLIDINDYDKDYELNSLNTSVKLIQLFSKIGDELKKSGFPPIILHYNNFDKVKDAEKLLVFLQDLREFFDNKHAIIILLGNEILEQAISSADRLRQKYQFPPVYIDKLSLEEIKEILRKRVSDLRIDNTKDTLLYEDGVIEVLYNVFNGNIREILNSMSFIFQKIAETNVPIKVNVNMMRDILSKGVYDTYISKLSPRQREILKKMMEFERFTNAQIAEQMDMLAQNLSQSFIPKLIEAKVIDLIEEKGREKYYAVRPEIHWWKLERKKEEIKKDTENKIKKIKEAQLKMQEFGA